MKAIVVWLALAVSPVVAHAATQAEAEAALAAAKQAEAEAARYNNRWLPAEAAVTAAEKAIAAHAWDVAVAQAATARAMGLRAVEQSREQETAWRDAVIR
jgi:hypothetical protein